MVPREDAQPEEAGGNKVNILVACEHSGVVRQAFRALGHNAWSCDLLPADDNSKYHLQEDVLDFLLDDWDMLIAFPPCQYLTGAGLHWNTRRPGRAEHTEEALQFVQALMGAPIPKIAIENPVGIISTRIRKPDQIIQPYEFGEDASKRTCFWLKNLPPLPIDPAVRFSGRFVNHKNKMVERWSNQTDSGQNRLGPSPDRWKLRSRTYPKIAAAMAATWGAPQEETDGSSTD